jgi:Glycosyl transferase family 2
VKLVLTVSARNEEDVIEANVLYHLNQGIDFIIATENNSTDATPEILERFQAEGVLRLIREPSEDWDQFRWVTRMARLAATEHGADWVIHTDADEFWWPRVGTLKDIFSAVPPEYGALAGHRLNFIPNPDESGPFHQRMTVVELRPAKVKPDRLKPAPLSPKMAHRASPDVSIGKGNHNVLPHERFPVVPGWQPIVVFHYPVRSYAQFESKVRLPETALERSRAVERPVLNRLYREGRLREVYETQALGPEAVEEGVRAGRLAVDERMKRFLAALGGVPPDPGAAGRDLSSPADLALDLAWESDQNLYAKERSARLRVRLSTAEEKAVRAARRRERAGRWAGKLERRREALEAGACARIGARLSRLRRRGR